MGTIWMPSQFLSSTKTTKNTSDNKKEGRYGRRRLLEYDDVDYDYEEEEAEEEDEEEHDYDNDEQDTYQQQQQQNKTNDQNQDDNKDPLIEKN